LHRGFGAAALYLPLKQHSFADILFSENRSFKIYSATHLYKKAVFLRDFEVEGASGMRTLPWDGENTDFMA